MIPTREEAERLLTEAEKAYILGFLHDIGRKFGVQHLGHVYDGWQYMLKLGYEEVKALQKELEQTVYDDYDKLIQLCDAIGAAEGVVDMEERMADIKRRYGSYPQEKWDSNLALKRYFEEKAGNDIYKIVK